MGKRERERERERERDREHFYTIKTMRVSQYPTGGYDRESERRKKERKKARENV